MPDEVYETIRAKRFELVDDEGDVRALLSAERDSPSGLTIRNKEGNAVVHLGFEEASGESVAVLSFGRGPGQGGVFLKVHTDDAEAFLALIDNQGKPRVHIAMSEDGAPMIRLGGDINKGPAVYLAQRVNGTTGLLLDDAEGKTRAYLGLSPDGDIGYAVGDEDVLED